MRWTGHEARIGEMGNSYNTLVGNLKGKDQMKVLGADLRIIIKWILEKQGGRLWTGLIWLRIQSSDGLL
jgi:hypothetical protein